MLELKVKPVTSAKAIELKGIILDDQNAKLTGAWQTSTANSPFYRFGYSHDGNEAKGQKQARFETELKPGQYEVRILYPPNTNRASNTPVTIHHANGETTVKVNQRQKPANGPTLSLGTFEFQKQAVITVTNKGTDGYVIVDAFQLLRVEE